MKARLSHNCLHEEKKMWDLQPSAHEIHLFANPLKSCFEVVGIAVFLYQYVIRK